MKTVITTVSLPIAECTFSAKRSETERPSGLAYILLKMMGAPLEGGMTFSEFMDELGLPEDIFPLFKTELEDLLMQGMVEGSLPYGHFGTFAISDFKLTEVGKKAFQSGVIAKKPQDMRGTMFYTPAENSKIHSGSTRNVKDIEHNFNHSNYEADPEYLEDFLKKHKEKYGVDSEEDIFDFILEKMDYQSYDIKMTMEYNDATASFSIPSEKAVDPNFIKNNFNSESVLSSLENSVYELKDSIPNPKKWAKDEPEWTEFLYILPSDFTINTDNLLLANKKNVNITEAVDLPKSLFKTLYDYDVVEISSYNSGYAYSFIRKDVSVDGLEGTVEKNMIIRRNLSEDEIHNFIDSALSDFKKDKEYLKKSLRLCKQLSYDDKIKEIIQNAFLSKKVSEFAEIGATIKDIFNDDYSKFISQAVETEFLKANISSNREETIKVLKDLSKIGIKVESDVLLNKIFTDVNKSDILKLADSAINAGQNAMDILRIPDVGITLAERLNSEIAIIGDSTPFMDAENTRYNLDKLKGLTGVESLRNHSLNLDLISDEDSDEISKSVKTLNDKYRLISPYLPGTADVTELKGFIDLFSEVDKGLNSLRNPTESKSSLLKSKDVRMVGISLGVNLERAFKDLNFDNNDLSPGIEELFNSELISESEYSMLQDIRDFRNRCAHDLSLPVLDNNVRKEWINLVFKIKQMPMEGKKKEGKK